MELKHRTEGSWRMLAMLVLAGPVWAPAALGNTVVNLRAVDVYRISTQQELAQCADAFRRSFQRFWLVRSASDYRECITRAQADANSKLAVAARTVRKADAHRALVVYHAAFLAAISGIEPHNDELTDGYEQRQSLLLHIMSHAWSRYELVE